MLSRMHPSMQNNIQDYIQMHRTDTISAADANTKIWLLIVTGHSDNGVKCPVG